MSKQQQRLPHQIDPFRLAEAGSLLSGEIPVEQMRRLSDLLADTKGHIRVSLQFDVDELGVPCVQGRLQVELELTCQRCLEPYHFTVDHPIALAWVHAEAEIEKLPTRYEPYLVESTPLMLRDVLEDELLLALPAVPMHPVAVCAVKVKPAAAELPTATEETRDNPFAVLADLKTTRKSK